MKATKKISNVNPEEPFYVYYKEKKYNVANFISKHPGGQNVILEYKDKDITAAFDHIGHSDDAKFLLFKRLVKSDEEIIEEEKNKRKASLEELEDLKLSEEKDIFSEKEIIKKGKFIVRKLFTEEDKYFVHKILGFLSLISFIYRYFYVMPSSQSLGFGKDFFSYLTLTLHMLLSTSSLIFHVLTYRIPEKPLIIYEEYRIHAILFTLRSFIVAVIGINQDYMSKQTSSLLLVFSILAIHLLVDYVTQIHGTPGMTAVRVLNKDTGVIYLGKRFYGYYQFLALASHLVLTERSGDLGFNTIIAIQSSAFFMTLQRKNITGVKAHAFFYALCLFVSSYYIFLSKDLMFFALVAFLFALRAGFNLNKYVIWLGYVIYSYKLYDESTIVQDCFRLIKLKF
jgi:hypothetical protein